MDQGTLVEDQIEGGRRILERLATEGVPVTAAGWLKESDTGEWFLYLATPLVGEDGAKRPAYRRVNAALRPMTPARWVDSLEIKVVGLDSPVGRFLRDLQARYPGRSFLRYGEASLASLGMDGAYLYPPVPAPVR
jgi:hypothetical protein